MKKFHIVILILIAVSIGVLVSFMGDLSTYETIASARQKARQDRHHHRPSR
jgi:Flp pilus assembly protein CpaB